MKSDDKRQARDEHPVQLEVARPERLSRWLPFVKWILITPHTLALSVLGVAAFIGSVVSFVTVVALGREARPLWDFTVGVQRWAVRLSAYNYLLVDRYPPFSLAERPDYPVHLTVECPEHVARWRPLVQPIAILPLTLLFLLMHLVCALLALPALVAIVVTGRMPLKLHEFNLNTLRWRCRVNLYAGWAVTVHPPLEWQTEQPHLPASAQAGEKGTVA